MRALVDRPCRLLPLLLLLAAAFAQVEWTPRPFLPRFAASAAYDVLRDRSIDLARFAAADFAGHGAFAVAVPADPALLGAEVFAQGATVEPGANPAGVVVTQGRALRFGGV
ncbi:MAG: hypothetical protein AB7O97_01075 [Planctomycetota bacterium]